MKNNPLTTVLLVVLAVSAVWSAILCVQFVRSTRELRALQGQAVVISNQNNREAVDQAILNDAILYSTNHPEILPILESLGIRKSPASQPVSAPAATPSARPSAR